MSSFSWHVLVFIFICLFILDGIGLNYTKKNKKQKKTQESLTISFHIWEAIHGYGGSMVLIDMAIEIGNQPQTIPMVLLDMVCLIL